jgi:hypothetical protein
MQGNRPRAYRLGAVDAGAEQKRRTGDATKHGGPAGGYAGVSTVFLQHTRMSSGGSAREQENPEVRGGVGIANQSGSIVSSYKSTTSSNSYSSLIVQARPQHTLKKLLNPHRASSIPVYRSIITVATSAIIATDHREEYLSGHSSPLQSPGIHFPLVLLHNQGYPKVCPDSLDLPNAGDPFYRNIAVIFMFFVFPDQGLKCFDLESSKVFSVKFPKPSLFQISELLHFIDFRKKFIKVQNQLCLKP